MEHKRLFEEARKVKKNSYSPYSHFPVGAALALSDGNYISAANIENASYGLCMCAERNALFAAYNQGYKKENIKAIAVSSNLDNFISPCGACRQVMSELMDENCEVYLLSEKNDYKKVCVKDLLPFAFESSDLNGF